MPFMNDGRRNYKREKAWEDNNKPERAKQRAMRNKARRDGEKAGVVKKFDGKHIDHKIPLSKGGTNEPRNRRVVSASTNLRRVKRKSDGSLK